MSAISLVFLWFDDDVCFILDQYPDPDVYQSLFTETTMKYVIVLYFRWCVGELRLSSIQIWIKFILK